MIKGKQETIDYVNKAEPGNRSIYVNMEAINELPDEYEAILTEIIFNPNKLNETFSNVGGKNEAPSWMPTPSMMYKIAEARGISGLDNQSDEPLIEEIDINPLLCKPIEEAPLYRRMTIGRKVTKTSSVMQDDGTMRLSSPCTVIYNVWDRCCEAWSNEEKWTKGYSVKGKYPNKYQTKYDRQLHFQNEMKFAHAKAETKAYEKTIRELAGLLTGYTNEDLKNGKLVFARIRRSAQVLKTEQAARLAAISGGATPAPAQLMFDDTKEEEKIIIPVESEKEKMLKRFDKIKEIPFELKASVDGCLKWINEQNEPEKATDFWEKVIIIIEKLEGAQ